MLARLRTDQQSPVKLGSEKLEKLKQKRMALKQILTIANHNILDDERKYFYKWKSALLTKKIDGSRVSLKMKAQILINTAKYESTTNLREAFLRWKIRSDPSIVKKAVEHFILYSKINDFNAFQRLKTLLPQINKRAKIDKKIRKNTAVMKLFLLIQKKDFQNERSFFQIQRKEEQQSLMRQTLRRLTLNTRNKIEKAFYQWHSRMIEDRMYQKYSQLNYKLNDEILKAKLIGWINTGNKYQSTKLVEVMNKFAQHRRFAITRNKCLTILKKNTLGKVIQSFKTWKAIPQQAKDSQKKTSKFFYSLNQFSKTYWRKHAFEPLQEVYDDGQAFKKRAMMLLVKSNHSDLQRKMSSWYRTVQLENSVKRCQKVISLFDSLHQQCKANLGILMQDENGRKQEKALQTIFGNYAANLKDAFIKWKNTANILKLQDSISGEKKKILISSLQSFLKNNSKSQLRQILIKFKKNSNITSIQDKFFKKLLSTKAGGVINSFQKWKNLPVPKDNEGLKKGRKFERSLEDILHHSLKASFDPLKDVYYEALNAKRYCIRKLLDKTMSANKRMFLLWAQYNKQAKQVEACKLTVQLFVILNQNVTAGLSPLMQNPREAAIKERALTLLVSGQMNALQSAFMKWKNQAKQDALQQRIQEAFSADKRKDLISRLQNYAKGNKNQLLRSTLLKFSIEAKRIRLIRDIQLRLLRTTQGQVLDGFQKWKSIPSHDQENWKKANKFEMALNKFCLKVWRKDAWDPLQEISDDAQALKKRYILLLVKSQESQLQQRMSQWNHNIKLFDEVQRCRVVITLFDSLNLQVKANLGLMLRDENQRKQDQALQRIFANYANNLRDAFSKWRNNANIMKLQDAITGEKKKILLESLQGFLRNSTSGKLKEILIKFKKNSSISSIQDRFFKKLLSTKAGGVINSFQKWKNLPIPKDNEALKKGRKFERSLEDILHHNLKASFDPLKDVYYEAQNAKRYCIRKLLDKTMSANKRMFLLWAQYNKQAKQVEACKLTVQLFAILNQNVTAGLSPLMQNPYEQNVKERALIKLISGQMNSLQLAFLKWKNEAAQDRIQQRIQEAFSADKKKDLINQLQNYQRGNQKQLLREVLYKFSFQAKRVRLIREIQLRLLKTSYGAMFDGFQKWKNIPQINPEKYLKASKFEISLSKICTKYWRKELWNPLQEVYDDGLAIKKRAVLLLFKTQESELKSRVSVWNYNVKLQDEVQRCKAVISLFDQLNVQVKANLGLILQDENQRKQDRALHQLFANCSNNLRDAFSKWRNNANIMKLQDAITGEKKKILLESLQGFLRNSTSGKLREILIKFKKNSSISSIQDRFFKKLLSTKAGGVINSFQKWKNLPIPKDNEALKKGRKFERSLEDILHHNLKASFDPLKDVYYEALNAKRYCIRKLLDKTMSANKRMFLLWAQYNKQAKQVEACKLTVQLFAILNQNVTAGLSPLMQNPREAAIKERALTLLVSGQMNALQLAFMKWKNQAKQDALQQRIQEAFSADKRKDLISRLQNYAKGNKNQLLRSTLLKFSIEAKRIRLIRDIQLRLLRTTQGQVLDGFQKWKSIPSHDQENWKKANKFEMALNKFCLKVWRKDAWDPLQEISDDAQALKKRYILLLVKSQESQLQQRMSQWNHNIKLFDEVQRCRVVITLFDSLNLQVKANLGLMLRDENQRKQDQALQRIFANYANNLRDAFSKWRNNANIMKLQDAITGEKKKILLESLQGFLRNSTSGKLREILIKFKKNSSISSIQDRFFKKLLSTKAGGVINSFQKWKNLPIPKDNEALKKGRKFERSLEDILHHNLKASFDPLKDVYYEALNAKRYCIRKLLDKTMSANKRMFLLWAQYNKQAKQVEACKLTVQLFAILNQNVTAGLSPLMQNPYEQNVKERALIKLISGQMNSLQLAFLKWKNEAAQDRIQQRIQEAFSADKKKDLINQLQNYQRGNQKQLLREVLYKFSFQAKRVRLIREIQLRLLKTSYGAMFDGFQKWKNIPQINPEKYLKASKFEISLSKICTKYWRKELWNPLQEVYDDGLAIKKRAVLLLFKTQESELKSRVSVWNYNVKLQDEVQRCKAVISLFDQLNVQVKANLGLILQDENQRKQDRALHQLFANCSNNLRDAFSKWRNNANIMKLQDAITGEKKKILLESLQGFLRNSTSGKLREILIKFKKNSSISSIQDRFFKKLLSTKAGGVINSFQKWKNLPIPKDNEALKKGRKFERSLEDILHHNLKASFDPLKDVYYEALNAKRYCIRKLLDKTMSANKRMFLLWAQYNKQAKQVEACKLTVQLFAILNQNVTAGLSPLMQNPREAAIKERALTLLVSGQMNALQLAFMKWKNQAKQDALQQRIQEAFSADKRKDLISRLQNYAKGNKNQLLRSTLLKFSIEAKRIRLIRDIQLRLLRTTQGQVLDGFQKWKSIPSHDQENWKKANKFEMALNKFCLKVWRKDAWDPLQEISDDAQALKKRYILLLVKSQESQLQQRMSQWNHNIKLFDEVQRCRVVITLFDSLNLQVKANLGLMLRDENQRKQDQALQRIFANYANNLRDAFSKWRNNANIMKLQDAITGEKKKILLESLQGFLRNSTSGKLREILIKFKKNSSISSIQDRFFKKLLSTKAGGVINSFQKWKNLPIPKDNEALKKGRKFERSLEDILHHNLKASFDPLKDVYYEALNAKRYCIRKLLDKTMSANKRMFLLWAQYNKQAKQVEACKLTVQLFAILNQNVTAGLSPLMQNPREAAIKERALSLLVSGQMNALQLAFMKWKNQAKQDALQQRIQEAFSADKRKDLISRLQNYAKGNKNQLLRSTLLKFSIEAKRIRLIRDIQLRLLRTTQGQVLDGFQKWKSIPSHDQENWKKANKFEMALNKFCLKVWRKDAWDPLQEISDDAQALKKRYILLLVKSQESQLQQRMSQWNHNIQLFDEVQRCRVVITLFDSLNLQVKANLGLMLRDENQRKQDQALQRIFANYANNLRDAFSKWRNNANIMKLQDAITGEKKKILLESLQGFLRNSTSGKLREILIKFKKNSSISSIQDRFFKKLLSTKAGGVINSFQKWKNLPIPKDNEALKKGRKFERSLEDILHHNLKASFDPLKDVYYEALNAKRYCIRKLLDKTMSANKRMFLLWAQYNKQAKQVEACKLTVQLFAILNQNVTAGLSPLMQNPYEQNVKERALIKLISGQMNSLQLAFLKWKNEAAQDRIQQRIQEAFSADKKKDLINQLQNYQRGNQKQLLREVLYKFSFQAKRVRLIREIQLRLLKTSYGAMFDGFQKWKNIPQINPEKYLKASKFEISLSKICTKYWRKELWNPLQEVYDDGLAIKKRAVLLLFKTQESELKSRVSVWNYNVKLQDEVQRCKAVISLFDQLNVQVKANLGLILQDENQRKQDRALHQLFANCSNNLRDAFSKWRNNANIMKLQDAITGEKKKILLESLQGFLRNSTSGKLREILIKFKKNSSISSIQDRFFKKLLSTKAGGVINSFQKWKNLPIPKDNEALKKGRKFERSLEDILHHNLKASFDPLKDVYYEALNAKRYCIRKLLDKTMSANKRMFLLWAQYNKQAKQVEACKLTVQLFAILNQNVTAGLSPLMQNPREAAIKERALSLLVSGQMNALQLAFMKWKNQAKQDALQQRIQEAFSADKRKDLISRLQNYAKGNKNQLLRSTLLKFSIEAKRIRLIRDIQLRLLRTTQGQVLDGFQKWKSIPSHDQENWKKANKFEMALNKFCLKVWRKDAWDPLQEISDDAQALKKRYILLLVKSQESQLQQRMSQWNHNIKLFDEVQRCRVVITLFDSLNLQVKANLGLMLRDENQRKQDQALQRIFANYANNLRDAFSKWRNNANIMKLQDAITGEKKKILLESLQGFLRNSTSGKLKEILIKFKKNSSISSIQDRFFKKLLSTKAGGVINSFQKWKNLPIPKDNEALKKGRKFERSLEDILHHNLKASFDPLKDVHYEAQNAKRYCIRKLLDKTMSANKRMFLLWAQYNKQAKQVEACKLTVQLFAILNQNVTAGLSPLMQNPYEQNVKERALIKLISGQMNSLQLAFLKWKNEAAQDRIQQRIQEAFSADKKKDLINQLQNYQRGNQKQLLREVLYKFSFQAKRVRLIREIQLRLLKTSYGAMFDGFQKWKKIPQINPEKYLKASKFEISLSKICTKYWRKELWNPLQEVYDDGLAIKKRAVLLLFKTQESELKSRVSVWNYNVKLQDEVQRCKAVISLFDQLNVQVKANLGLILQDENQRKQDRALHQLFANCSNNLRDAFSKWRNNANIMKLQDAITGEKKKILLESLQGFLRNSTSGKLREILIKFKKNSSISSIQDRFFKKLLSTKAGGVINSFQKWKNLPIPKDNEALKKGRKFERSLEDILHHNLKASFDPLKDVYYEALNAKRYCIRKLLDKTMSANKRMFLLWAQYNKQAKQVEACKLTVQLFAILNQNVTAGLSPLMQNPREAAIKERALSLLVSGQMNALQLAFIKWKNQAKQDALQQRIQEAFSADKRKDLISRLQNYAKGNKNQLLRSTLLKFSIEAKRIRLIRDIQLRLLRTTQGQVLDGFQKWKSIPSHDQENWKKANKFEMALNKFCLKVWRKDAWDPLQEISDDAQALKKRYILLLVKSQESQLQQRMSQWNHNIKLFDEVQRCRVVITLFDSLNLQVKANLGLMLRDENQRKQDQALQRIFANYANNLRDAFSKWRNNANIMKLQDAITGEKKKILLESLQGFLRNSTSGKLKEILIKFKKNSSISSIQDRFFKKLLSTKAGGVINSFQKWKNLPIPKDNEALKKGRKFERSLEDILHHNLKASFDPLKDVHYEAQNAKRYCIRKLLDKTMSANKRMFLLWAQYNKQAKQVEACKLTVQLFAILNQNVTAGLSPLMQNPYEQNVKERALIKLISGQMNSLQLAFLKWKNEAAQDRIQQRIQEAFSADKKKDLINQLQNYQRGNQKQLLREVLYKFSFQAKRVRLIREIQLRLLKTSYGAMFDGFQKWKKIPQINPEKYLKASKFEISLSKICTKYWRKELWNPLQEVYDDGLAIKKRAVLLLFKTQESELKSRVSVWNYNVKLQDEVQRCKAVISLFDQLNVQVKANLGLILQDENQRKQDRALHQLFANCSNNLRDAFSKWRNNANIMKLQDAITGEKKKILLESLQGFLRNSTSGKLREILIKFKKNSSISSIQDRFFKKLLSTKAGGVINSFQKWKNLPIPKDNEALKKGRKFERSLEDILHHNLKASFDPLKDVYYEALNAKRYCIRKLLDKTMSANKRMFLLWAQYNKQAKQVEACKLTVQLFAILNQNVTAGLSPLMQNPREAAIKERALSLLVSGQMNALQLAFMKWKNQAKQDALQQRIQEAFSADKRKDLISRLQNYAKGNKNQLLRSTLLKFSIEAKRIRLIRDIQLRLLRTTQGQVLDGFQKWKSIPSHDQENWKKANKFEMALNKFCLKVWRKDAWDPLQEISDDAQALKKRYILLLVKSQESQLQQRMSQWNHNIKLFDEVQRCRVVITLFDSLNLQVKANLGLMLRDENQRKQDQALQRIFANYANNLRDAFSKWRNNANIMKLQDAITGEKKKILLESLQGFLKNSTSGKLREILIKFKKNSSISSIQDRFFKKLLSTKAGGVINSFQKWKNLPIPKDNEALKKGRKFERSLEDILHHSLKASFDPLKDVYYEALNAKRYCIRKLLDKTMSANKRMFLLWAQYNKQAKQVEACKLTVQLFAILNQNVTAGLSPLMQNPREAAIKERALSLLVSGQMNALQLAFMKWKNQAKQDALQQRIQEAFSADKRKDLLSRLQNYAKGNKNQLLRSTLLKFSIEAKRIRLIRDIQLRLLRTTQGQVLDGFQKWKSIPSHDQENWKKANKFEMALNKFCLKVWRKDAWDPLQEISDDAQALKKRYILLLVKTQESQLQQRMSQWNHNIKLFDEVQRCRGVIALFDSLNLQAKANLGLMLRDQNQRKQDQALQRIFANYANNLRDAFSKWRNNANIMKLQDTITGEKKKILLESLKGFLRNSTSSKLREILIKFKKNSSISTIQDRFFKKLLSTKAGGVINSFQKWKNLPIPKDNEALKKGRKFERSLENILYHGLKSSFDPLKDVYFEALNAKRYCIRKLLDKTMSANKRMFLLWAQYNKQAKQVEACKLTVQLFAILNQNVAAGLSPLMQNPHDQNVKEKALIRIMTGQMSGLRIAFFKWRENVIQDRLTQRLDNTKRQFLIQNLTAYRKYSKNNQLRYILAKFKLNYYILHDSNNIDKINELKQLLAQWEQMFKDSYQKWKDTEERLRMLDGKQNQQRNDMLKREAINQMKRYHYIKLKSYFDRWKHTQIKYKTVYKCFAVQRLLSLNKFVERAVKSYVLQKWRVPKNENPWFKRVAGILAKNCRITPQISYWRIRDNALAGGVLPTLKVMKCKKMFNNLRKAYDRTLTRAFLSIEQQAKPASDNSFQISSASFLQQTPIRQITSRSQADSQIIRHSQLLAIHTLTRIVKSQLKKNFATFILNGSQSRQIGQSLLRSSINPQQFKYIHKQMGAEKLISVLDRNLKLQKLQFLKSSQNSIMKSDSEFASRINGLIVENQDLRNEINTLQSSKTNQVQQLEEKDKIINDLNRMIDQMRAKTLLVALEHYQDHLIEDAFNYMIE